MSKKDLKEKIEQLESKIEQLEKQSLELCDEIGKSEKENTELIERITKLKKEKCFNSVEELLNEYNYVILVNKGTVQLYNDGRFEQKFRGISFNSSYDEFPKLHIYK